MDKELNYRHCLSCEICKFNVPLGNDDNKFACEIRDAFIEDYMICDEFILGEK